MVGVKHSLNKDVKAVGKSKNWEHKRFARRHCWEQLLLHFKVPLILIEEQ